MKSAKVLLQLIQDITNIVKQHYWMYIDTNEEDYEYMEEYLSQKDSSNMEIYKSVISKEQKDIEAKLGLIMTDKNKEILYTLGSSFNWRRGETKPREGYLYGGFSFDSIDNMFFYPKPYWELGMKKFEPYESIDPEEFDLIKKLSWFEATIYPERSLPRPNYGCFLLEENSFPSKFYFYSNGLCYLLPFDSFKAYISALVASCGVVYWQYFYIDPEVLIYKNHNKAYVTHALYKSSHLAPEIRRKPYDNTLAIDRLDIIHEHLERCVRLLPSTFPFADFTHHQNYYKRFKELYDASKKE